MSSSKIDLLGSSSEDSDDLCMELESIGNNNFPFFSPEVDDAVIHEEEEEKDAFVGACLVSVLSPSAVTHATSGHFTSLSDVNLIVGRGTRLEIFLFCDGRLQVVKDIHYCGQIMVIDCLRSLDLTTDRLVLLSELSPSYYKLWILQWNSDENRIIASCKVDIPECFGEFHRKKIWCIDHEKKLVGVLFRFRFKVWRLSDEEILEEIVSFRVGSTQIEDICFLHKRSYPAFMIHFKDNDRDLWSRVSFSDLGDITSVEWLEQLFPSLVPLSSCDGFIGISGRSVRLKTNDDFDSIYYEHDIMASTFAKDGSLLIADAAGYVHMVQICEEEKRIHLKSSMVANGTSIASALVALTDEYIFIGSSWGNSQLVNLRGGTETIDSTSTVVDMCILEQNSGQEIVVASGSYQHGSLHSVSHSCTFKSIGSIEMGYSIGGFWTHVDGNTMRLVYSTMNGYFACEVSLEALWSNDVMTNQLHDITTTTLGGFDMARMHLYSVFGLHHVQVTDGAVILLSSETRFVQRWECPGCITVAASFEDKVLVAYEKQLTLLQISGNNLEVVRSTIMPAAVCCLNIGQDGSMVAIGMWHVICLASFPLLSEIESLDLNGEPMIRSVVLFQFHEVLFLVFGDAEGSVGFNKKENTLKRLSKVSCSSTPITELKTLLVNGVNHILAVSREPVVLCVKNGGFAMMPLDLENVSFLSIVEPNRCFWILQKGDDETEYGTIESGINVKCLNRTSTHGRSIRFHKSSNTFLVSASENGLDRQEDFVRHSFILYNLACEKLSSFALNDLEYGWSIASGRFSDNGEEFYCAGTVYVDKTNQSGISSHSGRIFVFRIEQRKLQCLVSKDMMGPVYALQFCNSRLVATVGVFVYLFSLQDYDGWELDAIDSKTGNIANKHGLVHLATYGSHIVAGSSVGSPYLIEHKEDELEVLIDELIGGFEGSSATICLSGDLFISANLENLTLTFHAPQKENKWEPIDDVFIGEFVTSAQPFCFPSALQASTPQPWFFSTAVGGIRCVIPLVRRDLNLLVSLCDSLSLSCWDEILEMRGRSARFIDGDYISLLLSLDQRELQAIVPDVPLESIVPLIRYIASFRLI